LRLFKGCETGAHEVSVDDRTDLLVGSDGLRVLDVVVGVELEVTVDTPADRVGSPGCGVVAQLHGRREDVVREMPVSGRPVLLVWRRHVWRRHEQLSETTTWSERSVAISPKATLTERARKDICRRAGMLVRVATLAAGAPHRV
jgi:hypothetical protein